MKNWLTYGLLAITLFTLSACAGYPAKKDTPFAAYNTLIVRPINWNETITDKITGDEATEFSQAQPKLAALFQTEFEKYAPKVGYFEKVLFTADAAPKGALVLEPKIVTLDPGIRWVMNGAAVYQGILKDSDGKQVAKYMAQRKVGRPLTSTMMGAIETMITELGEDAMTGIPEAK
ncbi:hypothetical protein [Geomonas sp.]|uniref:hypothetical protein n=1 Tax=Geomonas sp. TaxID=2651584 RepID=UPI002B49020A|nr:hypothetical protein [Geomonas sp.]HJV36187.1 hypothetical protein [Geomonas sp.]